MREKDWDLTVGGGGSNVGYGLGDDWPTVVNNGFTGV